MTDNAMRVRKRWIKNIFALSLIVVLFYLVDWRELSGAFSNLSFAAVFLLLAVSILLVYASAMKWSYFLEALSRRVSVFSLFSLYIVGYFVNLLVPSYIGGDALRSYYVGRRVGQHEALTATILERYTGLAAMLLLALVCMWFSRLVTWQIKLAIAALALAVAAVTSLALSPRALAFFGRITQFKDSVRHLERIQSGFHLVRSDKKLLLKAMALSFLYHGFTVFNTVVAAWAVGWHNPPWAELFVVLPVILLIGSLPLTPSGLGLQEGAFFYFLQGIGASPAEALGVAVLLRAKSYCLALAGGVVWLTIPRHERSRETVGSSSAEEELRPCPPP